MRCSDSDPARVHTASVGGMRAQNAAKRAHRLAHKLAQALRQLQARIGFAVLFQLGLGIATANATEPDPHCGLMKTQSLTLGRTGSSRRRKGGKSTDTVP